MIESKYRDYHRKVKEVLPNFLRPTGARYLVELLPQPEVKTAGGLIMGTAKNYKTDTAENQFNAALILDCGTGYVDEDGETVDLEYQVGQVVEIVKSGARIYSTHPLFGGTFVTSDLAKISDNQITDVIANSLEEYNEALRTIESLRAVK